MEYAYKNKVLDAASSQEENFKEKLKDIENKLNKYTNNSLKEENSNTSGNDNGDLDDKELRDNNDEWEDYDLADNEVDNNEEEKIDINKIREILEKALQARKQGINIEEFFKNLAGKSMDEEQIMNLAEEFCSVNGIDLNNFNMEK